MSTRSSRRSEKRIVGDCALARVVLVTAVVSRCATNRSIMPTPLLYTGAQARRLFIDVPVEYRTPSLDLLFITDRASSKSAEEDSPYTAGRSRSMAFGSTIVEFGDRVSWDTLVRQSSDRERARHLELRRGRTQSLRRGRRTIDRVPSCRSARARQLPAGARSQGISGAMERSGWPKRF
jgi:hypothetical protein